MASALEYEEIGGDKQPECQRETQPDCPGLLVGVLNGGFESSLFNRQTLKAWVSQNSSSQKLMLISPFVVLVVLPCPWCPGCDIIRWSSA